MYLFKYMHVKNLFQNLYVHNPSFHGTLSKVFPPLNTCWIIPKPPCVVMGSNEIKSIGVNGRIHIRGKLLA